MSLATISTISILEQKPWLGQFEHTTYLLLFYLLDRVYTLIKEQLKSCFDKYMTLATENKSLNIEDHISQNTGHIML